MNVVEPIRECILLSDFQTKSDFVDSLSTNWKYYLINVGEVKNNIAINRLDVVSRIKVPDQLLKIKTTNIILMKLKLIMSHKPAI